jgi:uncharacterized phage protein (TIGR01671 family)
MREILFRGKLKSDINPQMPAGSWVYGGYYFWKHGACIHEEHAAIGLYVEQETVGRYTGLKDKNGKRIFEGDIVNACYSIPHYDGTSYEYHIGKVARDEYVHSCVIIADGTKYHIQTAMRGEVIGNIHDNPELLEGE